MVVKTVESVGFEPLSWFEYPLSPTGSRRAQLKAGDCLMRRGHGFESLLEVCGVEHNNRDRDCCSHWFLLFLGGLEVSSVASVIAALVSSLPSGLHWYGCREEHDELCILKPGTFPHSCVTLLLGHEDALKLGRLLTVLPCCLSPRQVEMISVFSAGQSSDANENFRKCKEPMEAHWLASAVRFIAAASLRPSGHDFMRECFLSPGFELHIASYLGPAWGQVVATSVCPTPRDDGASESERGKEMDSRRIVVMVPSQ